jgi:nitrate reductase NapAB chaperone NapD
MPISGVVITCQPDRAALLAESLAQPDQVEIHGRTADGSLVAVIEAATVDDEVQIVKRLLAVPGVLDVRLAYHHFGDENDNC